MVILLKEEKMRKSVKAVFGILIVLTLALSFTTCKKESSDQIVLTVLNYFDMSNANATLEITEMWEPFEKANPDIKIVREDLFNEPFHQKTEAYSAAGRVPDIIYCWPSGRSTTLHTRHLLKDLAPFIQRDGMASQFTPASLDPSAQAGGYLAMLTRGITATNAFLVNLEVLNDCGLRPAKTYSELKAQVPILKAKGYETVIMANVDTWVMQSCLFSSVVGRFCGEGWHQRILSGEAAFTDPDFVAALNFIKTIYDDGVISRTSITTPYNDAAGLFSTNKGAYLIDGDWRVGDFLTDQTTGLALISPERQKNFLVTIFPEIDLPGVKFNRSNTVVLATGWGMSAAIPEGSPKEEAAWKLIKWLVSKEVQIFLLETGTFGTSSRTDIDITTLNLEPMQMALGNLGNEYDIITVVIDDAFEGPAYTPLNDGLQAIGLGVQTPQQVAALTQAAFEAWKASR
jgi:raffinose/stachyose/melibiose transport system substrate-binding protein